MLNQETILFQTLLKYVGYECYLSYGIGGQVAHGILEMEVNRDSVEFSIDRLSFKMPQVFSIYISGQKSNLEITITIRKEI